MIPTSLQTVSPTLQATPLALISAPRLMLTEKSAVTQFGVSSVIRTETITMRITLVTTILKEIPGYRHGGIND
jgi:hypothetical protein